MRLLAVLAGVAAQAPGGQQIGNGPAADHTSGETLSATQTGLETPSYTFDMGPWSEQKYLEGTWTSKSQMVLTGPDFYDPVDELLIEPALPGISFSFTKDGYFEQALYQITSNPSRPDCPSAALTFQHGKYEVNGSNSLILNPFAVDGRQLVSDPCNQTNEEAEYTRYHQKEIYQKYEVLVDDYYGRYRLNLYQFDGTPMAPMYLVYKPPQMLPTQTMNPTGDGSSSSKKRRGIDDRSVRNKVRRALKNRSRTDAKRQHSANYDTIWWAGISMMAAGTVGWIWLS